MLIVPLAQPNASLAVATIRLRKRIRMRTDRTSPYRDSCIGDMSIGDGASGVAKVRLANRRLVHSSTNHPIAYHPISNGLSEHPRCRNRPPADLHFPDDVLLGHPTP